MAKPTYAKKRPQPAQAGKSSSPQGTEARGLRTIVPFLVLALLAVLPYLNSLQNGFVYDDATQVLQNPDVRSFNLHRIFGSSVWSFFTGYQGASNYYRPIMTVGYAICYRLFGFNPFGFHLANLLLNVAVVLLLFGLTRKLFGSQTIAFFAAALFAIHPIHSEAVDWIGSVTELELALFALLTFVFYLAESERSRLRQGLTKFAMCASFALALLSKEQAMTLPLLATLYEHFYRSDRLTTNWRTKAIRYAPLWIMDGAYILLRTRILHAFAPVALRPGLGIQQVLFSAVALFAQYMWKLIWPAHLSVAYGFPADIYRLAPWAIAGLAIGLICAVAVFLLWKRARPVSFGVLWFAITLAPVLNVRWMPASAFGERYLYLPSMGFVWMAAWAGVRLWNISTNRRIIRAALVSAAGVILLLGVIRIVVRNADWQDDLTLYKQTLSISPGAYVIRTNLGGLYWDQGDIKEASQQWQQVLKTEPTYPFALEDMGLVMRRERRYPEALKYFTQCLRFAPDYVSAHVYLAMTYEDLRERDKARSQLDAALKLDPSNVTALNVLGEVYVDEKNFSKAEEELRRSIAIQPTLRGLGDLGFALWGQGDIPAAEKQLLRAESFAPSSIRIHLILGSFYATIGRTRDAVQQYQTALALDPSNARALAALKNLESQMSKGQKTGP